MEKYTNVISNPPFVGFTYQSPAQKADMQKIFPKIKNLDYVAVWYKKVADFMINSHTRAAFVATNSISQGESPRFEKIFSPLIFILISRTELSFGIPNLLKRRTSTASSSVSATRPIFLSSLRPKI